MRFQVTLIHQVMKRRMRKRKFYINFFINNIYITLNIFSIINFLLYTTTFALFSLFVIETLHYCLYNGSNPIFGKMLSLFHVLYDMVKYATVHSRLLYVYFHCEWLVLCWGLEKTCHSKGRTFNINRYRLTDEFV